MTPERPKHALWVVCVLEREILGTTFGPSPSCPPPLPPSSHPGPTPKKVIVQHGRTVSGLCQFDLRHDLIEQGRETRETLEMAVATARHLDVTQKKV